MRRLLAMLVLPAVLGGCSVSTLESAGDDQAENTCELDSDCGSGICVAGICRAPSGEIGTALVQISAPSESGEYSLLSFLQTIDSLPHEGGAINLQVPVPAKLEAEVKLPEAVGVDCAYGALASPTVPVSVRFRPSERVFGLASADVEAETSETASMNEAYRFTARMAPGKYDVYVDPTADAMLTGGACSVVPQVFRNFEVSSGIAADGPVPLYLQPPSTLNVIVDYPIEGTSNTELALEGWNVDLLDPVTGWVLSRKAELRKDVELSQQGVIERYVAVLQYSQLPDAELAGKELLRIAPPTSDPSVPKPVAPTFVLERKAVELFKQGEASINQIVSLPQPISVDGYLFDSDAPDAKAVSAELTLRFVSKTLILDQENYPTAPVGAPVYFSTDVQSSDGKFQVELLPGDYDVYAIPTSSVTDVAVTKSTLTVAVGQNPQTGKSIVIDPTTHLQGIALGPNGVDPVAGASVRASASPAEIDPIWIALGLKPPKPLSADGLVGKDGSFVLDVHPGALDVSIRPADSSGFAWLVRPNVVVQDGIHDLGKVELPLPVVYEGVLKVDTDTPLPNALIQAYVFLNAQGYTGDRSGAQAVVQVAETRADATGFFQLLLPARLN